MKPGHRVRIQQRRDQLHYYTSTTANASSPGGVAGYVQDDKIQQGSGGTPILQDSQTYISHSDANGNTIYPQASATTCRNSDGTGAETTSYSYTWFAGSNDVQSMATSLPIVSAAQNGPGAADVITNVFNNDGEVIWQRDGAGFLNYMTYDTATGALLEMIKDVNTNAMSGDEASSLPAGWVAPPGGGENLETSYEDDAEGRTTEETA